MNGDGLSDLLFSYREGDERGYLVIFSTGLSDLDAADGAADRVISLGGMPIEAGFVANKIRFDAVRFQDVVPVGDVDNDGYPDLLLGRYAGRGQWQPDFAQNLFSMKDWTAADGADRSDGYEDGVLSASNMIKQPGTWKFNYDSSDHATTSIDSLGDLDGDGRVDMLVRTSTWAFDGTDYILFSSGLDAMDRADGVRDKSINLRNVHSFD